MTVHSLDGLRQLGVRISAALLMAASLLIAVVTAIVSPADLWVVLAMTLGATAFPLAMVMAGRHDVVVRSSFGIAAPILPGIMLFVMRGHAWQMDMHMLFFAGLAALMLLCDWRPILVATLVTAAHHLILSVALPQFVFGTAGSFGRVMLHAAILLVEAGVLIALSFRLTALITAIAEQQAQASAADEARRAAERERAEEQQRVFAAQRSVTHELQAALGAIANGDLCQRLRGLPAEFRQIEDDFNRSIGSLAEMIGRIVETSHDIENETGGISGASTELASVTEQHAAAIAEATGALARISEDVGTIAARARETAGHMNGMEEEAARGSELAHAMRGAMHEVVSSTAEIAAIVEVIDQIAFQTNLLALNAGVEAARAGDAGHGFAVVAHEVRALSERTTVAAQDVRKLIGVTKSRLDVGMEHVSGSATVLEQFGSVTGGISALMQQIVGATDNQSRSLQSMSKSVDHISSATHRNAAMAEECDAAVRHLRALADTLGRDVGRYKVTQGRSGGQPARYAA